MSGELRLRDIATIAGASAIVAGAVEVADIAVRSAVLGQIAFVSPVYPWMTPAAWAILTVPAALLVHVALLALRRPPGPAPWLGMLTATLGFALMLPHTAIAWWASAAFTGGAGMHVYRRTRANPAAWISRLRRIAGLLAILCIAGGFISRSTGRQALVPATDVRAEGGPNVLLIVLDTVRSRNLSLYGYDRPTTARLDQLARRGVVFDWAMSTSSWTLPSHGSLFTGRGARDTGGSWRRPIAPDARTITEVFQERGYATGAFVSNLLYASRESGLGRGFSRYDDYRFSWPLLLSHSALRRMDLKSDLPQARSISEALWAVTASHVAPSDLQPADVFRPADEVAAGFLDWQASISARPFFAFLNFFDAHGPYRAPAEYVARFSRDGGRAEVDRYDAAIAWVDQVVGSLLDELDRRGVLDRTLVIVTSDHGEHFGEHGLKGHANSLYGASLRVPLIMSFPAGIPAGLRVPSVVSLRDVPATILTLAGLEDEAFPGVSLTTAWAGNAPVPARTPAAHLAQGINVDAAFRNARGEVVAAFDERYHYIRDGDGREELYDYRRDPLEQKDLIHEPSLRQIVEALRAVAR